MDCSLPGSSVHRIFQAKILKWVAISYSRGSFWPRVEPMSLVFLELAGGFFTTEPPRKPILYIDRYTQTDIYICMKNERDIMLWKLKIFLSWLCFHEADGVIMVEFCFKMIENTINLFKTSGKTMKMLIKWKIICKKWKGVTF